MAPNDDPDEAADRLERALEMIAARAGRDPVLPSGASVADIADRLDALIARLRGTLAAEAGLGRTPVAQVTVKINGYTYTVGCEDGQEGHLTAMAAQVESRIGSIKALGGSSGEARLLVLASLLMADELHDMRIEADALRAGGVRTARAPGELGKRMGRLAARAEQIAAELERP